MTTSLTRRLAITPLCVLPFPAMLRPVLHLSSLLVLLGGLLSVPGAAQDLRPRTVITTDGEIDDVDSFVRLLLLSNELRIQGLVYSSSMWHFRGDGTGTTRLSEMEMTREMYGERADLRWPGESWMQEMIDDYAAVYDTLRQHAPGYPLPDSLRAVVAVGNINFEGDMERPTDGSDLIRRLLLDRDTTRIYLQAWGGTNTIARALKSIEETYRGTPAWLEVYREVCQKAVLYLIMDQDATYRDYVAKVWPDLPILFNGGQFGALAYWWKRDLPPVYQFWLGGDFMREHIIQDHGPLTANYYSYGDGRAQPGDPEHTHGDPTLLDSSQWGRFEAYDFISEGDSPAFLHLVDVGLGNLENPAYGGWGGRLVAMDSAAVVYKDTTAAADYNPYRRRREGGFAQARWIPALQREMAARADWCVLPVSRANHPPVVSADSTLRTVAGGDKIVLQVTAEDPDGNTLYYHWFQYGEADSYPGNAMLILNKDRVTVSVPRDLETGQTIHLIAEVTDGGSPGLTRYARFVLVGE